MHAQSGEQLFHPHLRKKQVLVERKINRVNFNQEGKIENMKEANIGGENNTSCIDKVTEDRE